LNLYTATLITAKAVIPAKAGIQTPSLQRQGTIILETWIPPYQVRGRLGHARNDKPYKTYVVMYNCSNSYAVTDIGASIDNRHNRIDSALMINKNSLLDELNSNCKEICSVHHSE
jgi:hypothetical protein